MKFRVWSARIDISGRYTILVGMFSLARVLFNLVVINVSYCAEQECLREVQLHVAGCDSRRLFVEVNGSRSARLLGRPRPRDCVRALWLRVRGVLVGSLREDVMPSE